MLDSTQLKKIQNLLIDVASFQVRERRKLGSFSYEEKSLNQLVSYVDVESEKMLVDGLKEITPGAGFITEEGTGKYNEQELCWIIDPLDGTTNYLFGHDQFAISIALRTQNETLYGGIYLPVFDAYYHSAGNGAFLNDKPIHCSARNKLEDTLIATGFPYYEFKELNQYLAILKTLMKETKGLRRMGSAAIDLAFTAEGKFDGFFELNLSPWDVAAGAFIIQQAGGRVQDFKAGSNYIFGRSIIAGNPEVTQHLQNLISKEFE